MSDVVIGAWREGLTKQRTEDIKDITKRASQGFRLGPLETFALEMSMALDAYDLFLDDLHMDCDCDCCVELADMVIPVINVKGEFTGSTKADLLVEKKTKK